MTKAMKKKRYTKPQTQAVIFHAPVVMLGGSNQVNDYQNGSDIIIGDSDTP